MNIDKDGKLDMFGRQDMRILEEFGWNFEDMARAIIELRNEITDCEKNISKLEEELDKAIQMSGEQ